MGKIFRPKTASGWRIFRFYLVDELITSVTGFLTCQWCHRLCGAEQQVCRGGGASRCSEWGEMFEELKTGEKMWFLLFLWCFSPPTTPKNMNGYFCVFGRWWLSRNCDPDFQGPGRWVHFVLVLFLLSCSCSDDSWLFEVETVCPVVCWRFVWIFKMVSVRCKDTFSSSLCLFWTVS